MSKNIVIFSFAFVSIFIIDQNLKMLFLNGFRFDSECISLVLAFNKGVAFSMLAFLDEYLKYLQLVVIIIAIGYLYIEKVLFNRFTFSLGMLFGAGSSNLLDRFIHDGVVDYLYWRCYFDFAIFNFADVVINIAVAIIIFHSFKNRKVVTK
jgi:signal peptidase II